MRFGSPSGKRRTALLLTAALLATVGLAACGADKKEMPAVVGLQLDDAHNVLKKAGFKEFKDIDAFEKRTMFPDSSWVVVAQNPAAGSSQPVDLTVDLRAGKKSEQRALDLLPAGSPVLAEAIKDKQEEAAERYKNEAEAQAKALEDASKAKQAAQSYIQDFDPTARLSRSAVREVDNFAKDVRAGTYSASETVVVGSSAVDLLRTVTEKLKDADPPDEAGKDAQHDALVEAAERYVQAGETLLSASGSSRASSLTQYYKVRAEARKQWNAALRGLYSGSGQSAPVL